MGKATFKASRRGLGKHAFRAGLLTSGLAVGASADKASQAGGVAVAQTIVQWPGKPATQALDITLPNGHRLVWDTENCRLFAWYDQRGMRLTNPFDGNGLWINRSVVIGDWDGRQVTAYSDAWGSPDSRPIFQGSAITSDGQGITLTYTLPNFNGYSGRAVYQETYRPETHSIGVPYHGFSVQIRVQASDTAPSGIAGLVYAPSVALAPGGSATGMTAWTFNQGSGIRQTNFVDGLDIPMGGSMQPWVTLMHPQGTFLLYATSLWKNEGPVSCSVQGRAAPDGPGVQPRFDRMVAAEGVTEYETDRMIFLFSHLDLTLPIPQRYLNHRFYVCRELWNDLGIPAHARYWYALWPIAAIGRISPWRDWWNVFQRVAADGGRARRWRIFAHIDALESTVPGDPSTIRGPAGLQPELYLPNAVENLPPGDPYADGTLSDWKNMLDALRALGIYVDVWHRSNYSPRSKAATSTLWSRWNRTSSVGKFWLDHPDWSRERNDGTFTSEDYPNPVNPAFHEYMKGWIADGYRSYGVHGLFLDTGGPGGEFLWYQRKRYRVLANWFLPLYSWIYTNGMYWVHENPMVLHLFGEINTIPWATKDREWSYVLCGGSLFPKDGDWSTGTSVADAALLRRLYCMLTAVWWEASGLTAFRPSKDAVLEETDRYIQRIERFGIPDRIELINPVQTPPPAGVLRTAITSDPNDPNTGNGGRIEIDGLVQFPDSGRIRIDDEVIWYKGIDHSTGGKVAWGIRRGHDGTAPQAHSIGTTVTCLDSQMHWSFSDVYWVYGSGDAEVWVRYSDGTVWERGGRVPTSVPTISNVQVTQAGTSIAIRWTTDVACIGWVEYDTFGMMETYASQRREGWSPAYCRRSDATQRGTEHTVILENVAMGVLYHYRIVVRGPAQAATSDRTFVLQPSAVTVAAPVVRK